MNRTKGCEECESNRSGESQALKDRVWGNQLQCKEIIINGDINEDLIERAVLQIFNFNNMDAEARLNPEERQPIIIYINTNGGTIDDAFSLVSAIEGSKTPVVTVALGKAYSAGFFILLAGHQRYAQKYSQLMLHQGSSGYMGKFADMIEYAKHWERLQNMIDDYIISRTKIKKKKLQEIFNGKQDWFIETKEAIDLGIINGIWEG